MRIELKLNGQQRGSFLYTEDRVVGEMQVGIIGTTLTVYHTEVQPQAEPGVAGKLLDAMVEYARTNQLKVVPLCPYVLAKFKQHKEQYTDIWKRPG